MLFVTAVKGVAAVHERPAVLAPLTTWKRKLALALDLDTEKSTSMPTSGPLTL